jgi:dTDP-4-amino-4,6-dideoxygalactose transaminase
MLRIAGIRQGDEVIVPSYTFIATAGAVVRSSGVPVFIDINSKDYLLDIDLIEGLITPKTKAIIPVYFGGNIPDMDRINRITTKHHLVVIEDAAQAHGGKWNERFAGNFGKAAGFSFQYSKNMTANEGGIIVSNDREFIEKCWEYIWHGRKKGGLWYEHFQISSNFRLTEFQAAILIAQLKRLERQNQIRHQNGLYLDEKLSKVEGISVVSYHRFLEIHPRHIYIIKLNLDLFAGVAKEKIVQALNAEGIPALPGYGFPLYKNPAFQKMKLRNYKTVYNPKAEQACKESIWLMHQNLLGTKKDMEDIVRAVQKVVENRGSLRDMK